jgi:hypothetical protein
MTANPEVQTATADRAEAVIDTLLLSFVTDPIARYIWPRPQDYVRGYGRLAMALGGRGLELGTAHILGDGQAAALWLPPGVEPDGDAIGALIGKRSRPSWARSSNRWRGSTSMSRIGTWR